MYKSLIDIPPTTRASCVTLLQGRLFDAIDLETQLKQAHWNVKGRNFFQLHELFDRIHDEVEGFVDTLAERITALGHVADGRIATAAEATTLPAYPLKAAVGSDHLKAVAVALGQFGKMVRGDADAATKLGDADTADVFTELSRESDRQLWFVEAHLIEE